MAQIVNVEAGTVFIGGGGEGYGEAQNLLLKYANRHGLIAGATGTGKTVTLQTIAESFSQAGVPVFMADVKGDLAGIAKSGGADPKLAESFEKRAAQIGITLDYQAFPVTFWDIWGVRGHPVRTTPAEMGPLLLSRLMGLTDAQEGVLNIAFRVADEEGLALLDLKDLQAMLVWVGQNAKDLSLKYGNVSTASVGAIQRALMVLENEGGNLLFGEPALELADMMRLDEKGQGMVNILSAEKLMNAPRLYATFLLWLMSELFEQLPEVGDPDKPKMAFFFDEAHLLFDDAPDALVAKIEQVARLIRSKGVSLWFISQNPADLPDSVLGQLGNRVQHALRAFTAKDQKALRLAAENYRPNPAFATADAIQQVGTGEAVTSLLEAKGVPGMVQRTLVRPPLSQLGPIPDEERAAIMAASPMAAKYGETLDRESAAEMLKQRADAAAQAVNAADSKADADLWKMEPAPSRGRRYDPAIEIPAETRPRARASNRDTIASAFGKSLARQLGTKTGQALVRGVLGSLFRGK
ncbi:MAG TPA: helicase HerA-like domain-containing protein [Paracoccus sp. (in: a-proteobacteria)]|uniref:helicase HerA-like domain-containing protein n=1 Tax=Paracoccus sp. TaxID=267 RepID=UPI002C746554|nr:helicase HerA-like domain-containing protein [Paracoccus sp. (in: a-proteobacteria)]HWL55480.1 helicase HerA-like domain-containing protein [Paracoccus sp. (in: a-proteobacteria)]